MIVRRSGTILVVGLSLLVAGPVGAKPIDHVGPPDCRVRQLALTHGPEISPATGQNPLALRLTNRGQRPCALYGYPAIRFSDRAGSIPFSIGRRGDQMVDPRRPARVVVRVGRAAFVLVNKYRCDLGDERVARVLRLGLPDGSPLVLSLPLPAHPRIGYCGKGDSGSLITSSPFAPSIAATLRKQ